MCDSPAAGLIKALGQLNTGNINLMEVCGTHTMAIARGGIKSVLPDNVKLLSGPGCPVCVTPFEVMDAILNLAEQNDVIITTYGDLIRVPGSKKGRSLGRIKSEGGDIRIVYSPVDAVKIASENSDRQVVFLGAGFETTAPGTAIAVKCAANEKLDNFTVFSMLKTVEPALRTLINDPSFNVQGFICPGHVATIIGEKGFKYLSDDYNIPGVISGFEPEDILISIYRLMKQIEEGKSDIENEYARAVSYEGNPAALKVMMEMLEVRDDLWRGLGLIPESGLRLRTEYSRFDAEVRFDIKIKHTEENNPCRCGDVIQGKISPEECPLFGTACTPEEPTGPCMVSSEGACAAAVKYSRF